MKIQLRDGTFETNSSSEHTVVLRDDCSFVKSNEFVNTIKTANDLAEAFLSAGIIKEIKGHIYFPIPSFSDQYFEFGHGFEMLTTWTDKFFYLLASFRNFEDLSTLVDLLKEKIPQIDGIITQLDETAFGNDEPRFNDYPYLHTYDCIDYSFGSIDHQSHDNIHNLINALKEDEKYQKMTKKEIFEEIIFCNKFIIVVDSDSSETFYDLLDEQYFVESGFTHVLTNNYEYDSKTNTYSYNYALKTIDNVISERKAEEDK